MSSHTYYPPVAFSFLVKWDDCEAGFSEASGLEAEREVTTLREGGENRFAHQVPGAVKHKNLVLKRGLATDVTWLSDTLEGGFAQKIETKTVSVSLTDAKQMPMMTWVLTEAWPVKWFVGGMYQGKLAIETLEFAYASVTRK